MRKKLLIICLFIFGFSIGFLTHAEQSGSSPDTGGAVSVINRAYDFLVSKGTNYGNFQPADWNNDWGTYWNRIMYSATWEPDGTAIESDVVSDKTFYSGSNNRTIKTGEASAGFLPDYSLEQYVEYDDYEDGDYEGEESTWIATSTAVGANVYQDTRTGLYWATSQPTTLTNIFPDQDHSTCDFFNTGTYPTRGEYGTSGTDPDCGNAINACAILSLASIEGQSANTDWYLPSQKELQEAYADGMYNQAGSTFTTTSLFWSSTERSDVSAGAWDVFLHNGVTSYNGKTGSLAVRCVRRD